MRILLTGATGFIGQRLGKALVKKGHGVVVLLRKPNATLSFPAEIALWESKTPLRDIDAVIHLAGESIGGERWTKERKKEIILSRTQTTEKLKAQIDAILGRKPTVILAASAIGFYGSRGDQWLSENFNSGEGFLAETCIHWEKALEKLSSTGASAGTRLAIYRIGIVLGREGGALKEMLPIFKSGVGAVLGDGKQWMSWIDADDLVDLFLFGLENESVAGVRNAVSPEPVTNEEFTKALAKHIRCWLIPPAPKFALKIFLGEMAALVLQSQRVEERFSADGFNFQSPKLSQSLKRIFSEIEGSRGTRCNEKNSEIWVPAKPAVVFDWFKEGKNFSSLLPSAFNNKGCRMAEGKLADGAMLAYCWKWGFMPFRSRTMVVDWQEGKEFTTAQEKGPNTFWFVNHRFLPMGSGTLVQERVVYRLPCGLLGQIFLQGAVSKKLDAICAHRIKRMQEVFKGAC